MSGKPSPTRYNEDYVPNIFPPIPDALPVVPKLPKTTRKVPVKRSKESAQTSLKETVRLNESVATQTDLKYSCRKFEFSTSIGDQENEKSTLATIPKSMLSFL